MLIFRYGNIIVIVFVFFWYFLQVVYRLALFELVVCHGYCKVISIILILLSLQNCMVEFCNIRIVLSNKPAGLCTATQICRC